MKQKILGLFLLLFLMFLPLTAYAADIYLEQFLSNGDYTYLTIESNKMSINQKINGQKSQYTYTLTNNQMKDVQKYLEKKVNVSEKTKDGMYIDFYDEKKKDNAYKIVITEGTEVITALSLNRSFDSEIITGDLFFTKLIEKKARETENPELIAPEYNSYGVKELISLAKFYINLYAGPIIEKIPFGKVAFYGAAALALYIILKIISKILKFIFSIPSRLNLFRHIKDKNTIDARINQLSNDKNTKKKRNRKLDNDDF